MRTRDSITVSALPISSTPKAAIVSRTKENRWNHTFREEAAPIALARCFTSSPPGPHVGHQSLGIPSLIEFFHRQSMAAKENCGHASRSWLIHADQDVAVRLDVLKAAAGSEGHAGQGVVRHRDRKAGRMTKHVIEIGKQGAATGKDDALVNDI